MNYITQRISSSIGAKKKYRRCQIPVTAKTNTTANSRSSSVPKSVKKQSSASQDQLQENSL